MIKRRKRTFNELYKDYRRAYAYRRIKMARAGLEMNDAMLTKEEYRVIREQYKSEPGSGSINDRIARDQQYEFSYSLGRRLKAEGEKRGLEWSSSLLRKIRTGKNLDLSNFTSDINSALKSEHPEWSSYQRRDYISHNIYGSP